MAKLVQSYNNWMIKIKQSKKPLQAVLKICTRLQ